MGKSAEDLFKQHGEQELVVLHNAVSYRDPDDEKTDPAEYSYRTAFRGETITVDGKSAERLIGLGSAAEKDTQAARFALAGMRDPAALGSPPSATAMVSPDQLEVQAIKAAGLPQGEPEALLKLDLPQLKMVAVAFGVEVKDKDTKETLAARITDPKAAAQAEAAAASARAHRDTLEQPGAGASTTESGVSPITDNPKLTPQTDASGEIKASKSAAKLAKSKGVDLAQVPATGKDGTVTQPDVVKFLADNGG